MLRSWHKIIEPLDDNPPLPFSQDISGNSLQDIGAVNGLAQLLTIKADRNRLTSARLEEVTSYTLATHSLGVARSSCLGDGGIRRGVMRE